MNGKKIGILFVIASLSLAGIGVSYATWTKNVDIYTTATTGHIDFTITEINLVNDGGAVIAATPTADPHIWSITLSNTFPGWKGYIDVVEKNAGTIPLKFYSFQILSLTGPSDLWSAYTLKFYPPGDPNPNIYGTLFDFQAVQYYSGWGVPASAITLTPDQTQTSLVSLELDQSITGYQDTGITFWFEMTATQV